MNHRILEYRPPRIAMALLVIAVALHLLIPQDPSYRFSSIYLSALLVAAGFAVMILAWWQFKERNVAICPTAPTDSLIIEGVYRFTRNPMYLGMISMLAGVAIFFGTLPFYTVTIIFLAVIDRRFCRYEEDKLAATFGREYADYRASVRRWL